MADDKRDNKVKQDPQRHWPLWVLLGLTLAFIWGNSMMPANESQETSDFFKDLMQRIFPEENAFFAFLTVYVRKVAHFTEFAFLGALGMLICVGYQRRFSWQWTANWMFGGFAAAFLDETIQIFSGRGPMISDVWIDIAGFAAGGLLVWLGVLIRKKWQAGSE